MSDLRSNDDEEVSQGRKDLCLIRSIIDHSDGGAQPEPLQVIEQDRILQIQAETDEQLIELWLHGRSEHTQRAYRFDVHRLLENLDKPLRDVTLLGLQRHADDLGSLTLNDRTIHRALSSIKSLFSYAHRIGYLPFDTGKPLRLPTLREGLTQRILEEGEVQRMIAFERHTRNHCILLFLYATGIRVSELCGLRNQDLQARDDSGQITVLGKGGKTRTILLPL